MLIIQIDTNMWCNINHLSNNACPGTANIMSEHLTFAYSGIFHIEVYINYVTFFYLN